MSLQTPKTPVAPKTPKTPKAFKVFKEPKTPQLPQAPPSAISVSGGSDIEDAALHLALQSPFDIVDWAGCEYDIQFTGSGISGLTAGNYPLSTTELDFLNSPAGTPFTITVKVIGSGLIDSASRVWPGISDITLSGASASPSSSGAFVTIGSFGAANAAGSATYEIKDPASGVYSANFNDGPRGVMFNIGLAGVDTLGVAQISPSFPYVPGSYRLTARATDSNGVFYKLFEITLS